MCFPLAIPLALMAGGAVAKMIGDHQAQKAQTNTYQAERSRQKALDAKQQGLFKDSLAKTDELHDPNAQNAAVADRTAALTAGVPAANAPGAYLPGSSSAPSVVATAADHSAAGTAAYTSNLAAAMARMGAPGDQLLKTNIGLGRNSQGIDQLSTTKKYSASVLDAEMRAAAHKGDTLRGLGGLASSIGGAMMGGMGGAGGAVGAYGGAAGGVANAGMSAINSMQRFPILMNAF